VTDASAGRVAVAPALIDRGPYESGPGPTIGRPAA